MSSEFLISLKDKLMADQYGGFNKFTNLAFGESYSYSNAVNDQIISHLTDIYCRTQSIPRKDIEIEFQKSFWNFAKQYKANELGTTMMCYSASTAIEITGNYLKKYKHNIALIEPTFDNLPAILQRIGLELISIGEENIFPSVNFDFITSLNVDAIFLVLPNNPTGRCLDKTEFTKVVEYCVEHKLTLVVDFCLRFFSDSMVWDQYDIAIGAGCDFIFIEDTGKTWPLLDLKMALLTTSSKIFQDVRRIQSEFILNVSPFILELLRDYIVITSQFDRGFPAFSTIQENRTYLRNKISKTILKPANVNSLISYEWIDIVIDQNDIQLWENLRSKGVYILPGSLFFWYDPLKGNKNIRIALLNNPENFRSGVEAFIRMLNEL